MFYNFLHVIHRISSEMWRRLVSVVIEKEVIIKKNHIAEKILFCISISLPRQKTLTCWDWSEMSSHYHMLYDLKCVKIKLFFVWGLIYCIMHCMLLTRKVDWLNLSSLFKSNVLRIVEWKCTIFCFFQKLLLVYFIINDNEGMNRISLRITVSGDSHFLTCAVRKCLKLSSISYHNSGF